MVRLGAKETRRCGVFVWERTARERGAGAGAQSSVARFEADEMKSCRLLKRAGLTAGKEIAAVGLSSREARWSISIKDWSVLDWF